MACDFNIPFTGPAAEILNKAKNAVESQGGTFNGDENAGNFDVSVFGNTIKGSYTNAESQLKIVIDSKPMFVSCGMIESFLKNKIAG